VKKLDMLKVKRITPDFNKYLFLILLVVLVILMLYPLVVIGINAFKSPQDYASHGPMSLPLSFYTTGLVDFWNRVTFGGKLLNSLIISLSVAILGVVLSLTSAFAMGIGKVKGTAFLLVLFLLGNFMPQEALVYPLYYFAKALHIYDTKLAVILVFTVIQGAFGTYLLTSVFSQFPRELIEAAVIDGSDNFHLLSRIILPLSIPTLSVLFVFFFIWTWNEFFLPLILLISSGNQTVPIAIATLQGQHNMDVTTSSASALLGVLPCILFFILFQRTLTRGIITGSNR
jgi:raffinose/stachyose/melibiose transport system permease protein